MTTPPVSGGLPLALTARQDGAALVVSVRGRIDHAWADTFKTALAPHLAECQPGRPVVLDLREVDYVASVGLRALMLAARQAKTQGGAIVVADLSPVVREIFEISKFTLVFPCYPGVAEALAALAPRPGSGGS